MRRGIVSAALMLTTAGAMLGGTGIAAADQQSADQQRAIGGLGGLVGSGPVGGLTGDLTGGLTSGSGDVLSVGAYLKPISNILGLPTG